MAAQTKSGLEDYLQLFLASGVASPPEKTYPYSAELSKAIAHIGYGLYEFRGTLIKEYNFQSPASEFHIGSGYVLLPLVPKRGTLQDECRFKKQIETPVLEIGERNYAIKGLYFDEEGVVIIPRFNDSEDRSIPGKHLNYKGTMIRYSDKTPDENKTIDEEKGKRVVNIFWEGLTLIDAPK